jgi:methyl-accepting chemotaxis protein
MFGKGAEKNNERVNSSEETTLRLSDDIGKMADRIGDMAERIGDMSERILETQKIQGKNLELMQESVMEAMKMMGKQMETTNKIMEFLVNKHLDTEVRF